jgi:hypothetical protein
MELGKELTSSTLLCTDLLDVRYLFNKPGSSSETFSFISRAAPASPALHTKKTRHKVGFFWWSLSLKVRTKFGMRLSVGKLFWPPPSIGIS